MKANVGDASNLAGRVLTTGIPTPRLDAATRRTLERLAPGGVVLFARNVEDASQLRALIAELHALPSRPLVSLDQEGGRVARLGPPFTVFPPAAVVGAAGSRTAYAVGRAMGVELASVGIDIDYAPVLDVHSNPGNPVIGDRAFGCDPGSVAERAVAFMRGLTSAGVVPCGKHFPGHGDTGTDSHLEVPIVRRSYAELDQVELAPFRAAIAAGCPMLMTAHVLYPALDPCEVATLSPPILGRLLRDQLGFRGVVVSDDLCMRAVSDRSDIPEAAVAALRAGADGVLVCHDLDASVRTAERIAAALRHGALAAADTEASAARSAQLRAPHRTAPVVVLPVAEHAALAERLWAMVPDQTA